MKQKAIWALLAVCIAAGLVGAFAPRFEEKKLTDQEERLEMEIADAQHRLEVRQKAEQDMEMEAVVEYTGVDSERIGKDKSVGDAFIRRSMEWSSYESYNGARQELMNQYPGSEDWQFFKAFMPDVVVSDVTPNGKTYNQIDINGLNVHLTDIEQHVVDNEDGKYQYLSFLTWITSDKSGNSSENKAAVLYETVLDDAGESRLCNVEGYTMMY